MGEKIVIPVPNGVIEFFIAVIPLKYLPIESAKKPKIMMLPTGIKETNLKTLFFFKAYMQIKINNVKIKNIKLGFMINSNNKEE
ncbi:MAG: hypothetical protein Q4E61_03315 [Alphaproteobacteria bacterium]|nr:hypothetical protein [Alphaproteobacteria bacterium]